MLGNMGMRQAIRKKWVLNRTISILLGCIFLYIHAFAQDTSNFFPHTIGNLHVYNYFVTVWDPPYTVTWRDIFDSTDAAGTSYVIQREQFTNESNYRDNYLRIDTTRNVYWHWAAWPDSAEHIYKLDAIQGAWWVVSHTGARGVIAIVESSFTGTIFGVSTTFKVIAYYSVPDTSDTTILGFHLYSRIIAGGLGVVFYGGGEMFDRVYLRAAYIDDVVYGDTTTSVDEHQIASIPQQFQLFQNYPNPFNPQTSVEYSVPKSQRVRLTIYNLLGNEVAILVDEVKHPGVYTVRWDATASPSGVYICQMRAGNFYKILKLIVMK